MKEWKTGESWWSTFISLKHSYSNILIIDIGGLTQTMCLRYVCSDRCQQEIDTFTDIGSLHYLFNLNILKPIVMKCASKGNFIV